jgi:hypothetical protein
MFVFRPRTLLTAAVGALAFAGTALAGSYGNTAAITIPGFGPSLVSNLTITGEALVSNMTVTLNGFAHQRPDDVDVLLVGPGGQRVVLMSDAGSDNNVGGLDLTFDDLATDPVTDEGALAAGTYLPTNNGPSDLCPGEANPDVFPGAPVGGQLGADLSVFDGTDPNGVWSLYVVDDCASFDGQILGGWSIAINPILTAVGVARFGAKANRGRVTLTWRTGEESGTLGFAVLRSTGHTTVRLNPSLIAARQAATSRGASYRFVDARVRSGVSYTYHLVRVGLDGSKSRAAAAVVRAR